jgi:23S rRNA (uracil1939-C5)-methyltransferase
VSPSKERVELRIDALAAGGDGVGRSDGRVVFVPATAPGDRVQARVVSSRKRFSRARLERVIEPGPARRASPCPYADRCGGCAWIHVSEDAQREARLSIVRDAFARIGGIRELPELEWLGSPRALGYRSRARVARANGRVGFRERGSREIVDVEKCAVLDAATQAELVRLRGETPPEFADEVEIRGFADRAGELRVGAGAFFQANAALWPDWSACVASACGSGTLAVELYAGVGFYTVHLEREFERVICVERARSARDLEHNAPSVEVHATSVERFVELELANLEPDVVLLNPPREGAGALVIDGIAQCEPARIVYVSCDPATLARDASRLIDHYDVTRVVVIDALPQTHHVETMCTLSRKTG